jgi:leader peptidase (prepilin peptidase) / N-methyltransferase
VNGPLIAAGAIASLPAGWLGCVLVERDPDAEPLFSPFPGLGVSRRHPMVHVFTTALFVATFLRFGDAPPMALVAYLLFFTAAVALGVIDIATLRLPDRIVAPLIIISIPIITVVSIVNHEPAQIRTALTGAAVYFGFLLLAHLVLPSGMGFGDVKLSAAMGLYIGWVAVDNLGAVTATLYAMIIGFLVGSAAGIVVFAFRRKSKPYPFGPFLIFGAVVVILASPQLLSTAS